MTDNASPTPGPWRANLHDRSGGVNVVAANGRTVAIVLDGCDGARDHDARIVAASRTMLEGMKTALDLMSRGEFDEAESVLADYVGGAEQMDGVTA